MHIQGMLETHPRPSGLETNGLVSCIEACHDCAQACLSCADACLSENQVQNLRRCIRLDLDCAAICETTAAVVSRQTEPDWEVVATQLEACATVCRVCAEECERHAGHHEHCRICAEACRHCEALCIQMIWACRAAG